MTAPGHWIIAPILIPGFTAVLLLLGARARTRTHRAVSLAACGLLLAAALRLLVAAADGGYGVYALGDWPPPFGIVLVLDRLSAFMVLLTGVLASATLLHALGDWDRRGKNFHALFQFQLMGLNGAFLTGDLFNLFVFFEILLIASYGLLLHGGGPERLRAGVHYVAFNLTGSALFLVAVGTLYGVTGTLNMADLAVRVAAADPAAVGLLRAGGLLLLVVFSVKAALLPLYFWLPAAYSAASAPVAALFAIMTKVGVYAILRVYTLVFGAEAGPLAGLAEPWLLPAALLTLLLGTVGVLSSRGLRRMVAYLIVASVGTLLTAVGLFRPESLAAAVYYMAHSTLAAAALFLLVDVIAGERGPAGDTLALGRPVVRPSLLGGLFLLAGMAVVGLPPLSGFVGKVLVLDSALGTSPAPWVFGVVLTTGLLLLAALTRAGSLVFWRAEGSPAVLPGSAGPPAGLAPTVLLVGTGMLLAALAGPITRYARATADQLLDPAAYVEGVLGTPAPAGQDLSLRGGEAPLSVAGSGAAIGGERDPGGPPDGGEGDR